MKEHPNVGGEVSGESTVPAHTGSDSAEAFGRMQSEVCLGKEISQFRDLIRMANGDIFQL